MTDKEIIIDGVNVAGCEFLYTDNYNDKCCSASIGGDCLCKPSEMICLNYVENLKKHIQRKERECEELECEKLKEIKENAKIAFQVLWAETHKKTAWSPHIYAQNMLLRFFGGEKALNEAKKKRKELLNKVDFKGEAADLFVTELEQELKDFKEKLEEYLEVINSRNNDLDRCKQALEKIKSEVKWVVDNREVFVLRDADRCKRILTIINEVKE